MQKSLETISYDTPDRVVCTKLAERVRRRKLERLKDQAVSEPVEYLVDVIALSAHDGFPERPSEVEIDMEDPDKYTRWAQSMRHLVATFNGQSRRHLDEAAQHLRLELADAHNQGEVCDDTAKSYANSIEIGVAKTSLAIEEIEGQLAG